MGIIKSCFGSTITIFWDADCAAVLNYIHIAVVFAVDGHGCRTLGLRYLLVIKPEPTALSLGKFFFDRLVSISTNTETDYSITPPPPFFVSPIARWYFSLSSRNLNGTRSYPRNPSKNPQIVFSYPSSNATNITAPPPIPSNLPLSPPHHSPPSPKFHFFAPHQTLSISIPMHHPIRLSIDHHPHLQHHY